jgi:hypothetical protein
MTHRNMDCWLVRGRYHRGPAVTMRIAVRSARRNACSTTAPKEPTSFRLAVLLGTMVLERVNLAPSHVQWDVIKSHSRSPATAPALRSGQSERIANQMRYGLQASGMAGRGSQSSHGSPTEAVIKRAHTSGSIPNALTFARYSMEAPTLCMPTGRCPSPPRRFGHGLFCSCIDSRRQRSGTPRLPGGPSYRKAVGARDHGGDVN